MGSLKAVIFWLGQDSVSVTTEIKDVAEVSIRDFKILYGWAEVQRQIETSLPVM